MSAPEHDKVGKVKGASIRVGKSRLPDIRRHCSIRIGDKKQIRSNFKRISDPDRAPFQNHFACFEFRGADCRLYPSASSGGVVLTRTDFTFLTTPNCDGSHSSAEIVRWV